MTEAVVIYARYSTDLQRENSLEDQVHLCRDYADRQGWKVAGVFTDAAVSGTSLNRKGYWEMVKAVESGKVGIVLAEAIDRLSRDQEDIHHLVKVLRFHGVRLFTCDSGENDTMHIGLKGIISEQYTKDLSLKVVRGQAGRVRAGKSGGGHCYGYDVVRGYGPDGEPITGELTINEEQAAVVRRVFEEYAAGVAPKRIAKRLNEDGIPSPRGKPWGASTLNGSIERGLGLLNNSLYIGVRMWNRHHTVKDPYTRNRTYRANDRGKWVVSEVPELRIVSDELWEKVKRLQKETRAACKGFGDKKGAASRRRPKFILSGLIECGSCGGGYISAGRDRWKCGNFAERGQCGNHRSISRREIEERVFAGLRETMVSKPLLNEFIKGWNAELGKHQSQTVTRRKAVEKELATVERSIENGLKAVDLGKATDILLEHLAKLGARRDELRTELQGQPEATPPKLKASMADLYAKKAEGLIDALARMEDEAAMKAAIRELVEKVVVKPTPGRERLEMDLYGRLAGAFTLEVAKPPRKPEVQVTPVAGADVGLQSTVEFAG